MAIERPNVCTVDVAEVIIEESNPGHRCLAIIFFDWAGVENGKARITAKPDRATYNS